MYQLWTDGSCYLDKGSWAFAIVNAETDTLITSRAEAFSPATNNRAELLAVINGLKELPKDASLEVVCDSAYIINCFKAKWYVKWRKNNWYGASGPVKNKDLWEELLALNESFEKPIKWTHVRGHVGHVWNELCDRECTRVRKEAFE